VSILLLADGFSFLGLGVSLGLAGKLSLALRLAEGRRHLVEQLLRLGDLLAVVAWRAPGVRKRRRRRRRESEEGMALAYRWC